MMMALCKTELAKSLCHNFNHKVEIDITYSNFEYVGHWRQFPVATDVVRERYQTHSQLVSRT